MKKCQVILVVLSIFLLFVSSNLAETQDKKVEELLTAKIIKGRYIRVNSVKEADYIQWNIQGEKIGRKASDGHYAVIDIQSFESVTAGKTYKVSIQAYKGFAPVYDHPIIIYITI